MSQDYHQLEIWQRSMTYAVDMIQTLIDEGNQIARMTHTFIQRLGRPKLPPEV